MATEERVKVVAGWELVGLKLLHVRNWSEEFLGLLSSIVRGNFPLSRLLFVFKVFLGIR